MMPRSICIVVHNSSTAGWRRGEPDCNGVIERFMRTLKEQCLYLHRSQTLKGARAITSRDRG
jgi:hypothetical protein